VQKILEVKLPVGVRKETPKKTGRENGRCDAWLVLSFQNKLRRGLEAKQRQKTMAADLGSPS
jgi:hypothetical protein